MDEHSHDYLTILGQLAREYQEKFADLQSAIQSTPQEEVMGQIGFLAEQTTDRFRAAQQSMFALLPVSAEAGKDNALKALKTMCRCFDEMRILFQVVVERHDRPE